MMRSNNSFQAAESSTPTKEKIVTEANHPNPNPELTEGRASSSETKPLVMYFWNGGNRSLNRGMCSLNKPVVAMQPG
uniref:Uncharacterized protein n=1 Tax=Salix viminalis TaxID=40686 RepID=A0A6N2LMV3_SALVM